MEKQLVIVNKDVLLDKDLNLWTNQRKAIVAPFKTYKVRGSNSTYITIHKPFLNKKIYGKGWTGWHLPGN